MIPANCVLTLVVPASIEEPVMDHLRASLPPGSEYWVGGLDAAGPGVILEGVSEQVRGRSRRTRIQLLSTMDDGRALIDALRRQMPDASLAYWLTPCLGAGWLP